MSEKTPINKLNIDIVYTWVNDKDKEWEEKKNKYMKASNIPIDDANSKCRYVNNNELMYSLRSVEKFAPWINRIFIVTDNQIPEWLDVSHPKIKIIDHKEIIPNDCLPTYNSIAIEHCIVNIPDLSENFLYANDDTFIARAVTPDFFYAKDGYPYYRFGYKYPDNPDSPYSIITTKTDELVKNKLGFNLGMFSHHNIDAYKKSTIMDCLKIFKKEITETIHCKFRESSNIERQIYSLYALATKQGHYKGVFRIDKYVPFYKNKLLNLLYKMEKPESLYIPASQDDLYEEIVKQENIKLFCINDGGETTEQDRETVKNFLSSSYPEKSSFEM